MNTAAARATISVNLLAVILALAAATRDVFNALSNMPWWGFFLTVTMLAFILSLPFAVFLSRALQGGGNKNRYLVIVLNQIFVVIAIFNAYWALQGEPFDALRIFAIGLMPVAITNVILLIIQEEP